MILKIIGVLVVTASSSLLGIYYSFHETYRINDLNEMKKALTILKSEIQFSGSALSEAFLNVAERILNPVSDIFLEMSKKLAQKNGRSVDTLWTETLEEKKAQTYLSTEDIALLSSFGKTLGYLDKTMQLNSIELTIDSIEKKIDMLSQTKNKTKRMYQSLGVLGGLLVAIILI